MTSEKRCDLCEVGPAAARPVVLRGWSLSDELVGLTPKGDVREICWPCESRILEAVEKVGAEGRERLRRECRAALVAEAVAIRREASARGQG